MGNAMAYWVHGRDAKTGKPDSMLSTANTPDGAREQAAVQGLIADTIVKEENPVCETIPLPIAKAKPIPRLRFKIVAIVFFISAIIYGRILTANDSSGWNYPTIMGYQCQLFAIGLFCWTLGVVFQSKTMRSVVLGSAIGVVLFAIAFFLTLILSPK